MASDMLQRHYSFYAQYHSHPVNQWIHIICVPVIYLTALTMLQIAFDSYASEAAKLTFAQYGIHACFAVVAAYCVYYYFIAGFGVGTTMLVLLASLYIGALKLLSLENALFVATAIHIASWAAQFVGHFAFEGAFSSWSVW